MVLGFPIMRATPSDVWGMFGNAILLCAGGFAVRLVLLGTRPLWFTQRFMEGGVAEAAFLHVTGKRMVFMHSCKRS
jgi:hypothetical protein